MNVAVNTQAMAAINASSTLQLIQLELKAPKSKFNKFGNFHYRSCEDILEAVKPLLHKYGATLVVSDEVQQVGPLVVITAKAIFTEADGKQTVITAHAGVDIDKKGMDVAQTFGASSSCARKYALNGLFLIDDTQDPDTDAFQEQQKAPAQQQANAQQQNPALQQNPQSQLTRDFQAALKDIQFAKEKTALKPIYQYFKGTHFEQQIVKACKAKKDLEGWSA
ncbi:ERF family protein [Acinetobacter soli]|uniref:ERF family protein n=2 Tax=Acinetobacter soli TaxID=487316 RepID=UPI000DD02833|nr:ERF family protein [Acinetobacter soli]MBU3120780.1 ERF family protein [Acinetobacter soli]RSB52639.1 Essential recombination function protein [Acinetobacter soli]